MCGIFGITIRKESNLKSAELKVIIDNLFILSEIRGKESSGIVIKNNQLKKIGLVRRSCNGKKFIKSKEYKSILKSFSTDSNIIDGVSILGHTRIATNGMLTLDNQPIVKNGCFGVHNGIIANIEPLWEKHKRLDRKQIIDTELLIGLMKQRFDKNDGSLIQESLYQTFEEIEGTASIGLLFNNYNSVVAGTNCGSLYYYKDDNLFLFASEQYILESLLSILNKENTLNNEVVQILPTSFVVLNEINFTLDRISLNNTKSVTLSKTGSEYDWIDLSVEKPKVPFINNQPEKHIKSILEYNIDGIQKLKRCTKCILPETHPYISFDKDGVCNFCRDYEKRKKRVLLGKEVLEERLTDIRKVKGPNCILMLSGGRDSCYALHVVKKELGLNPLTFTYDWGMLTDLGRRNQSRMCAKLGVEHLPVSADIKKNRYHIKLNVNAFLKKPHLGLIGLFMAGDKAYHHFAKELHSRTKLPLLNGGNPLEWTYFKEGFANVKPSFMRETIWDKSSIIKYFVTQGVKNPSLINDSVLSNLLAYKYYYMDVLNVTNLFHFLPWNEDEVNKLLIDEYNWEIALDTPTTWRIGDGTAAFYNYIYTTVAGFTENDCLRSNQILEGVLSRDKALNMVMKENKPRYESLKWYCDTIGIDLEQMILRINEIPKLYNSSEMD